MKSDSKIIFSDNENSLLKKIRTAVRSVSPDAVAVLYGSRARGDAGAESDWDILILMQGARGPESEEKFRDILYDIELETDTVISCIVRSEDEWSSDQYRHIPLKQEIEKEGIRI
ncbi:MAG: nucleotidyltransferase domain-containing protein [Desulfococcaceae bacterium]|nr:nucleotidyltransferase domain-containing protein [Desulfococcaceae bacterium]